MDASSFKVLFVGSPRAGKTTLINRILYDEFSSVYTPTDKVEYYPYTAVVNLREVTITLMDIGGGKDLESHHERWFNEADAFVFCFSISDLETLQGLLYFRNQIRALRTNNKESPPVFVTVGTHVDCARVVPEEKGIRIGKALLGGYFETCSSLNASQLRTKRHSPSTVTPKTLLHYVIKKLSRTGEITELEDMAKENKASPGVVRQLAVETNRETNLEPTSSEVQNRMMITRRETERTKKKSEEEKADEMGCHSAPTSPTVPLNSWKAGTGSYKDKTRQPTHSFLVKPLESSRSQRGEGDVPRSLDIFNASPRVENSFGTMTLGGTSGPQGVPGKSTFSGNTFNSFGTSTFTPGKNATFGSSTMSSMGSSTMSSMGSSTMSSMGGSTMSSMGGSTMSSMGGKEKFGTKGRLRDLMVSEEEKKRIQRRSLKLLTIENGSNKAEQEEPSLSLGLLESMRQKYDKPLAATPVFIEFPRCATKVVLLEGPPSRRVVPDSLKTDKGRTKFSKFTTKGKTGQEGEVKKSKGGSFLGGSPPKTISNDEARRGARERDAAGRAPPRPNRASTLQPKATVPREPSPSSFTSTSEDSHVITVQIKVYDWCFLIEVPKGIDTEELKGEIYQQSKKKLSTISATLEKSRQNLEDKLSRLKTELQGAASVQADSLVKNSKLFLESLDNRVEDLLIVSLTQPAFHDIQCQEKCQELKELGRKLIALSVLVMKNSTRDDFRTSELYINSLWYSFIYDTNNRDREFNKMADLITLHSSKMKLTMEEYEIIELQLEGMKMTEGDIVEYIGNRMVLVVINEPTFTEPSAQDSQTTSTEKPTVDMAISTPVEPQVKLESLFDDSTPSMTETMKTHSVRGGVNAADEKTHRAGQNMLDVLCQICDGINDKEASNHLTQEYTRFMRSTEGNTRDFSRFLQSALQPQWRLSMLLKCINQWITAVPYIQLKRAWSDAFPFDEDPDSWKIVINLVKDKEIIVTHRKSAISRKNKNEESGYTFQWEVVLRFDWMLKKMTSATFKTCDIQWDTGFSEKSKKKILKIFDQFAGF
ncbi:Ras family protein [Planoprotostelium fungivorum]|uniref:Ras family protein n=1 Tax=Planoprotostelium fungivorum TaxID=1890364 RepID=A0A2P6NZF3_9EUKA|nr:Ras family protein [Planoprotostelium fungivorum]